MRTSIDFFEFYQLKESTVGERIRLLRHKLLHEIDPERYTTKSISKRTGIAAQTITSIERGDSKKPSFVIVEALAKEFGVPIEVFTDKYYESGEKLFGLGDVDLISPNEVINEGDVIDLEGVDSIITGDKEYLIEEDNGELYLKHVRKVSFSVIEDLPSGGKRNLYSITKDINDKELVQILNQLIQTLEISFSSFSYNQWLEVINRSTIKEAYEIVMKDYREIPNDSIKKE